MNFDQTRRPEVIFVTHDAVSDQFDRRITDQAEIFAREGWNVIVACSANQGSLVRKGQLTLIGFSNKVTRKDLIHFETHLSWCQAKDGVRVPFEGRDLNVQNVPNKVLFVSYLGRLLPLRFKTFLKSKNFFVKIIRLITSEASATLPTWLEQSAKTFIQTRDSKPDLIVACDLPAAIGVMPVAMKHNVKWWFDAHEIFTEQNWVKSQGDMEKMKDLEKSVIRNATFFSSVNESAINYLLETTKVNRDSIVITNALKLESQNVISSIKEKLLDKNIRFIFHGGLSSGRSLYDFVSSLLRCADSNWSIDLFGWDPDPRLAELQRDHKVSVLPQVTTESIPELLANYDCVVLPYKVLDINTLYAMPNKLGDAIAMRLPVIYNEELVEVDTKNNLYGFGVPFKYAANFEETSKSLDLALQKLRHLMPNWEAVQRDLGYEWNESQILKILKESTN